MKLGILALALLLSGCGARPKPKVHDRIHVDRACIESIGLTPQTECNGPDGGKLVCSPIKMDIRKGCETLDASK